MTRSRTDVHFDDDAAAAGPGPTYLLFAGIDHPPRGGLHDLVGTYASERDAREAFGAIRRQPASPTTWAQLAVVDAGQALKPVCWFGIGAAPDGSRITASDLVDPLPDAQAGRRPRVSKRTAILLTAMVAVATSMVGVLVDGSGSRPPVGGTPAVSVPSTPGPTPSTVFEGGASADG